jgi:hypothetical protein
VEKYESAVTEYQERITTVSKDGKASEVMMRICDIFYDVFDSLFGKGASKKMFGKTNSVDLCVKAFKQLVNAMNDYSKTLELLPKGAINSSVKIKK